MIWVVIILGIVGYIIWKFNSDSKSVKRRNQSFGGMKKLFPEFVEYFEANGFDLTEDSGTKLIYKKALSNSPPFNKYLFIGIESKFTNVAFGYIITGDGKKVNGLNVEFRKNFRSEEVDMIIRKITGDFMIHGHLE